MRTVLTLASVSVALLSGSAAFAQDDDGLSEQPVKMNELPAAVANTMKKELGNNEATEIEAISFEGVIVLYEAEYKKDGQEIEIVVRPWGEHVPTAAEAEDDDADDAGDDDEGAQAAGGGEDDAIEERAIEMGDLPKAVADAFKALLGDGPYKEIEEVRYEGIVILYEAESDKGEMAVFPNGQAAQAGEDDDDEDGDDDEDDDA